MSNLLTTAISEYTRMLNYTTDPETKVFSHKTEKFSLYIPNIPQCLGLDYNDEIMSIDNANGLTKLFNCLNIGVVDRVDMVVKPNDMNNRVMAFIHFKIIYDNEQAASFSQELDECGSIKLTDVLFGDKLCVLSKRGYKHIPRTKAFIIIKKNTAPIPTIDEANYPLNIHQLVDVNKSLIEENYNLEKRIAELEEELQELLIETHS
jgi:hypothetical protein